MSKKRPKRSVPAANPRLLYPLIAVWAMVVGLAGCQAPAPGTWAARRQANIQYVVDLHRQREARRPEQLERSLDWIENRLAGHPEQAAATTRRILELD